MLPQLSFAQGSPEWLAWRHRGLNDLYFFCDVILQYGPKIPMSPQEHLLLCRFVERHTGNPLIDTAPYQLILVPREVGKTTIITQGDTIQGICRNPESSTMLGNEKEDNAKLMLSEIKRQFESNELLRALFPEVIPQDYGDTTWKATQIIVQRKEGRKEPTVFVTGEGGTVTGLHPDRIIVDDMLSKEAMENARVGDASVMGRVNRWVNTLPQLLSSNAKPFPSMTFVGTRWWVGDSYEHVEKTFGHGEQRQYVALRAKTPDGQLIDMPVENCYRVGDLAVYKRSGLENGRVAFPSKWPQERMTKVQFEDPATFACQVQNNPADESVAVFKMSWLDNKRFIWLDPQTVQFTSMAGKKRQLRATDLDVLMFVDPGGFSSSNVEDRARAAIVITGSTGSGEHLLLEAWSEHETFLAAIQQVIALASRYNPRKIVVELAGQQAAFIELLRRTAQSTGLVLPLQVERPGLKAKANRILELEPYFQQGHLYVSRSPSMAEFLEQYQRFPRTVRVDVLDALAYGPRFWRRETVGAANVEQRRAKELEAYRARRYGG
jgi:hypothetical protein